MNVYEIIFYAYVLQLLGAGLLALGIYIQVSESTSSVDFQQV